MFSFPILMTLKIWLIFHIVSSFMLFCLTLYLTQLLNSECYEKIQQEDVAVVKQQNFKFMGLPVFVISCSLYLYYIPDFFYFNQNHIISTLAFFVSCCSFYLVFAYMGTQFLDPKLIDFDVERIEKKEEIHGIGTLQDVVKTGEIGTPLLTYFGGETLRVTNEDRGIVIGAPGAGKTTYLISQIIDWMRFGLSFVVTDVKPEIYEILRVNEIFERFGYKDWRFNPTDLDSDHYNLFSEAQSSAELNEILSIIIVDENADARVFNDNARRLLKAVLLELGENASLPAAQDFINSMSDNSELLKVLRQSENIAVSNIAKEISRTAKNDNLLASIMTALSKAFDFLDDERIRTTIAKNASGFYLKDVLMKPKQAVFLQFDQQYKSSTATLFGAMVAHVMRILQANQNRQAVFIALDEIINCAPIPKFTDLLNTIRSARMPTFLYLQSLEGLNRLYGANADRIFLGSSNLKVVFKIGDIETAKQMSELIGKTETLYHSESVNSSNTTYAQNMSTSQSDGQSISARLDYILEPEFCIKQPMYHAVISYNGSYGALEMPRYWEVFDMPVRIKNNFENVENKSC